MKLRVVKLDLRTFLILLFNVLFIFTFFHEIIPVNNNMGWDGDIYKDIAKHGITDIQNKSIRWYYVFRIFPFIIYDLFGLPKIDSYILWFFRIINFIVILLSIRYYFKICNLLRTEYMVANLVFVLLFFSFPILKLTNYYPILTDHISFLLSLTGIYFTLSKNNFLVILLIIFSLFTFPSLALMLILINLFQKNGIELIKINQSKYVYIIITLKITFIVLGIYFFKIINSGSQAPVPNITNLNRGLLIISTILLIFYFIYITFSLLSIVKKNAEIILKINILYFYLSIIVVFIIWYILNSFMPMNKTGISSIKGFAYLSLTMPLNFLIYHTFYFGVLIIFLIAKMNNIFESSLSFGVGYLLASVLIYTFMIQNESRMLINLIPFLTISLLKALDKSRISKWGIYFILFVSLLQSRFYLKINSTINIWKLMNDPAEFFKFPVQRYFMNFGPWVSEEMYWIELLIFILLLIIYIIFNEVSFKNWVKKVKV